VRPDYFHERREIREYLAPAASERLGPLDRLRLLGLRLRLALNAPPLGSPAWHRLQDRLSVLPSTGAGPRMRAYFYAETLPGCGDRLHVHPLVTVNYPQGLSLGDHVLINRGVVITARAPIAIGSNVLIGPYAVINSGNHRFDPDRLIREQGHESAPIHVGDDVWIGSHATVLPGVTVGDGAVVGAGAVVTHEVPAGAVVGGVPAEVLGWRLVTET
jgi:acetyltransferase-like isoleucine patch superfamily enzyme